MTDYRLPASLFLIFLTLTGIAYYDAQKRHDAIEISWNKTQGPAMGEYNAICYPMSNETALCEVFLMNDSKPVDRFCNVSFSYTGELTRTECIEVLDHFFKMREELLPSHNV